MVLNPDDLKPSMTTNKRTSGVSRSVEELLASLPPVLEPEFVMHSPDEPIRLASGRFDFLREGELLGHLEGDISLEWVPKLRIVCRGESEAILPQLFHDRRVDLRVPQLQLESKAMVTNMTLGQRHEAESTLVEAVNPRLKPANHFRFYLVNFPYFFGEPIRTGEGPSAGAARDRLLLKAGRLECTIDRIRRLRDSGLSKNRPGYLLTHTGMVERADRPLSPKEIHQLLDALYWLLAFVRGARTGPVLPAVDSPFAEHWISLAGWKIDEPQSVHSWMPVLSPLNLSDLFATYLKKWNDPLWKEALPTMIAWYVAANSPSAASEARITLCQIALEVLASLMGAKGKKAYERIRWLLMRLGIPTEIPSRLEALRRYASRDNLDAPECLTRIRNKFEHPTLKNRQAARKVDGIVRMQAAQFGMELFELALLGAMNYRGKYVLRAFQGWRGDDEVLVPWA